MSQRFKLTLEYDGSAFVGWQRQETGPSVQSCLEEALKACCNHPVICHAAGRTDSGVHAEAMVAHVDVESSFTGYKLMKAANAWLRQTPLVVLQAEPVDDDFHARFSCIKRHYRYVVRNTRAKLALESGRCWLAHPELDASIMAEAAKNLIGHHDFTTFRATSCQAKSPVKTLDTALVSVEPHAIAGQTITFTFSARSFLHHQVRNMVGSLVKVGLGHWEVDDFVERFQSRDRTRGGKTAPAEGLFFVAASYPPDC